MVNIAEALIQQQERHPNSGAPDGYYVDDMGYLVENDLDQDRTRYAEYLLFRILRKHNNIYMRYGRLYCGHRALTGSQQEVLELADSPNAHARAGQVAWIFNRLWEIVPQIDETKIIISPDAFWDMERAEIRDLSELQKFNTTKGENVRARF